MQELCVTIKAGSSVRYDNLHNSNLEKYCMLCPQKHFVLYQYDKMYRNFKPYFQPKKFGTLPYLCAPLYCTASLGYNGPIDNHDSNIRVLRVEDCSQTNGRLQLRLKH